MGGEAQTFSLCPPSTQLHEYQNEKLTYWAFLFSLQVVHLMFNHFLRGCYSVADYYLSWFSSTTLLCNIHK
jgi:hypothetical protein